MKREKVGRNEEERRERRMWRKITRDKQHRERETSRLPSAFLEAIPSPRPRVAFAVEALMKTALENMLFQSHTLMKLDHITASGGSALAGKELA